MGPAGLAVVTAPSIFFGGKLEEEKDILAAVDVAFLKVFKRCQL